MEIRLAQEQDISSWMALVERVRNVFPGLETTEAMAEHRITVLQFIRTSSAICAVSEGQIRGALLFPEKTACFVFLLLTQPAADSTLRRNWYLLC